MAKKKQSSGPRGIDAILLSPTKKVEEAKGPLSEMFRQYLLLAGWEIGSFRMALDRWVKSVYPNDPQQQMSLKGNTKEQLAEDDMTLNTFKRGLEICDPAYSVLKLITHSHTGKVVEVQSVLDNKTLREFWAPIYSDEYWDKIAAEDENTDTNEEEG